MRLLLTILVFPIFLMACDNLLLGDQDAVVSLEENLQSPPALNDGWEVSDLSSEGIDAARILPWLERLHEDPKNIHSVLIIRNNRLVAEAYFGGWHRERLHTLRSASKSFVSTLTGIAVDKGYVTVDDKLFDFFPEYAHLSGNEGKNDIEIRHLLTMTSGLLWDEKTYSYPDKRNDEYALDTSKDRIGYILSKPMDAMPGTKFVYNSGGPFLQSAILERVTGEDIETFSGKHFFEPLGIKNYFWRQEGDDLIPATGPLFLCSRDMGKLGQLFLDKGMWKGKQIISSEWVDEATATFIGNEDDGEGYGYNWWIARSFINEEEVRVYMARGNGGQFIFVVPAFNAVVVFTGGNFDDPPGAPSPYRLLTSVILPAME
jgi:CubicO group peptidase (beta-lactamase class C family)